ncbi:hypothetical protein [Bordetella sp. LUAb4]|uniref:hypothetical protein n=1 Tax=Bordetella sp. LUAb4 TaxID=2843195 RepID=UPI001E5FDD98|nr:hypothetical protein [Bordetella sp. LUAb4]
MPNWTEAPQRGVPAAPLLSAEMPLGMRPGGVIQPDPLLNLVPIPGFCALPMVPMPAPMPTAMPVPASDGALEAETTEGSVRALDGSAHAILHAAGKLTELAERMRARAQDIALSAAVGQQSGASTEANQMLAAAATVMNMAGPLVATAADLFEARAARLQLPVREFRDTAAGPDDPMTRPSSPMPGRDRCATESTFDWPSDPVPKLNPACLVQADTPPPRLEAYGVAAGNSAALPRATANDFGHFAMR